MGVSLQVSDLKSYTEWLNTTFTENYFSHNYYGKRSPISVVETKPYLQDLLNFRVGPARLRQIRIKSRKSFANRHNNEIVVLQEIKTIVWHPKYGKL